MQATTDFGYPLQTYSRYMAKDFDAGLKQKLRLEDELGQGGDYIRCQGVSGGEQCPNPAKSGTCFCPDCEEIGLPVVSGEILPATPLPQKTPADLYSEAFQSHEEKTAFNIFMGSKKNLEEELSLLQTEAIEVVRADSEEFSSRRERIKCLTDILETFRKLMLTHHQLYKEMVVRVDINLKLIKRIIAVIERHVKDPETKRLIADELRDII